MSKPGIAGLVMSTAAEMPDALKLDGADQTIAGTISGFGITFRTPM